MYVVVFVVVVVLWRCVDSRLEQTLFNRCCSNFHITCILGKLRCTRICFEFFNPPLFSQIPNFKSCTVCLKKTPCCESQLRIISKSGFDVKTTTLQRELLHKNYGNQSGGWSCAAFERKEMLFLTPFHSNSVQPRPLDLFKQSFSLVHCWDPRSNSNSKMFPRRGPKFK